MSQAEACVLHHRAFFYLARVVHLGPKRSLGATNIARWKYPIVVRLGNIADVIPMACCAQLSEHRPTELVTENARAALLAVVKARALLSCTREGDDIWNRVDGEPRLQAAVALAHKRELIFVKVGALLGVAEEKLVIGVGDLAVARRR